MEAAHLGAEAEAIRVAKRHQAALQAQKQEDTRQIAAALQDHGEAQVMYARCRHRSLQGCSYAVG